MIFRWRDPEWGQVKRSCCWPWPCPVLLGSGQSEARIWGQLTNGRPGWGKSASPDAGMMLNTESQWWIISSKINDWTKACIGWHEDQHWLPSDSDNFMNNKNIMFSSPSINFCIHICNCLSCYQIVILRGCVTHSCLGELHLQDLDCNLWVTLCW